MFRLRLIWIIILGMLAACGTAAPPPQPLPIAATMRPMLTPEELPTPENSPAVVNDVSDTNLVTGDPNQGEELFNTVQPLTGMACATCHRADSEERLIGPGLLNINTRAITRVADQSAEEYIHNAIVQPSAYIVAGYPDIMPKNWAKALTEEQINDLMAYLLTLHTDTAGR